MHGKLFLQTVTFVYESNYYYKNMERLDTKNKYRSVLIGIKTLVRQKNALFENPV